MLADLEFLNKEASDKEITELSDLSGSGERNLGVINDAFNFVEGFIGSFISIPQNPTILLRQIAARLALIELRRKNEIRREEDDALSKECESYLSKMAAGKIPTEIGETNAPEKAMRGEFRHNCEKIDAKGYRL